MLLPPKKQIEIIKTENSRSDDERYFPQPFEQLTANFNGELVSIFDDGIYFRLSEINLGAKAMTESNLSEMNDFLEKISPFRNEWYRIPMSALTANTQDDLAYELGENFDTELFEPETVVRYFQENDIKTAISNYTKDILSQMQDVIGISDTEYAQAVEIIDLISNTQFFNLRDVISGRNAGFKFFTFNKGSIINMIQGIGKIIGETLSYDDIKEIRKMLSKFSLAGIYRINNEFKVIDNFLIKLTLRDIESLIESNIKYRYKISNFNKTSQVNAPSDYTEIDGLEALESLMMY